MSSSAYSKSTGVSSGGGSQAAASDSKSSSSGSGKYSSANGSAAGISSYYSTDYGSLSSSVAFSADHDGETSIRQSAMAKSTAAYSQAALSKEAGSRGSQSKSASVSESSGAGPSISVHSASFKKSYYAGGSGAGSGAGGSGVGRGSKSGSSVSAGSSINASQPSRSSSRRALTEKQSSVGGRSQQQSEDSSVIGSIATSQRFSDSGSMVSGSNNKSRASRGAPSLSGNNRSFGEASKEQSSRASTRKSGLSKGGAGSSKQRVAVPISMANEFKNEQKDLVVLANKPWNPFFREPWQRPYKYPIRKKIATCHEPPVRVTNPYWEGRDSIQVPKVTRFSKSSYTDMQARGGSKRRRASDDKKFSHTGFSISGEGGGGEEGEESKYSLFEDHPADFRTIPGESKGKRSSARASRASGSQRMGSSLRSTNSSNSSKRVRFSTNNTRHTFPAESEGRSARRSSNGDPSAKFNSRGNVRRRSESGAGSAGSSDEYESDVGSRMSTSPRRSRQLTSSRANNRANSMRPRNSSEPRITYESFDEDEYDERDYDSYEERSRPSRASVASSGGGGGGGGYRNVPNVRRMYDDKNGMSWYHFSYRKQYVGGSSYCDSSANVGNQGDGDGMGSCYCSSNPAVSQQQVGTGYSNSGPVQAGGNCYCSTNTAQVQWPPSGGGEECICRDCGTQVSESQISEGEAGGNCFCSANTVSHQPQQSVGTSMKSNRYPRNSYASAYPNLDDYTGDELEEDNAGDTDGDCCEENDCREVCAVARESSHGGSQNWSTAYANDSQTNQSMDNGSSNSQRIPCRCPGRPATPRFSRVRFPSRCGRFGPRFTPDSCSELICPPCSPSSTRINPSSPPPPRSTSPYQSRQSVQNTSPGRPCMCGSNSGPLGRRGSSQYGGGGGGNDSVAVGMCNSTSERAMERVNEDNRGNLHRAVECRCAVCCCANCPGGGGNKRRSSVYDQTTSSSTGPICHNEACSCANRPNRRDSRGQQTVSRSTSMDGPRGCPCKWSNKFDCKNGRNRDTGGGCCPPSAMESSYQNEENNYSKGYNSDYGQNRRALCCDLDCCPSGSCAIDSFVRRFDSPNCRAQLGSSLRRDFPSLVDYESSRGGRCGNGGRYSVMETDEIMSLRRMNASSGRQGGGFYRRRQTVL